MAQQSFATERGRRIPGVQIQNDQVGEKSTADLFQVIECFFSRTSMTDGHGDRSGLSDQ
jgi:hypothetical protein